MGAVGDLRSKEDYCGFKSSPETDGMLYNFIAMAVCRSGKSFDAARLLRRGCSRLHLPVRMTSSLQLWRLTQRGEFTWLFAFDLMCDNLKANLDAR